MQQDKNLGQDAELPGADDISVSTSTGSAKETDWQDVSTWCRDFLGLSDSELDSIWFERLAEASLALNGASETVLSLCQRATDKENPSWLCHRIRGTTHFARDQVEEAMAQLELALEKAKREGANPTPEAKDIVELHLLLAEYACFVWDVQRAAGHYEFASSSEDSIQAMTGQLGHLTTRLRFPNVEETRQWLKGEMAGEGGPGRMTTVLSVLARKDDHDSVVSTLFSVAKKDPDLLKAIVDAMERATTNPVLNEDRTENEMTGDDRFAEDEVRGVLLYYRAFAAYRYKVSPDGTEPVGEALRLWNECRDQLRDVGGSNALDIRKNATSALAHHYFNSMMDGNHLHHLDKLKKLAKEDPNIGRCDAAGFLGVLYALRDEKGKARSALIKWLRQGLQILSDDRPENDYLGHFLLCTVLDKYGDFNKAAVALSMKGQPDLVTKVLRFEAEDIAPDDDDVNTKRMLDMVNKLAEETVQVSKLQVPDASQQVRRIRAAKAHVDSLMAAAGTNNPGPEHEGDNDGDAREGSDSSEARGEQGQSTLPDPETASAHSLLHSRLSALEEAHTPQVDDQTVGWAMWCDGITPEGQPCQNKADFENEFYHCTYCWDRDFCRDCLAQLRYPNSDDAEITACSAEHQWLRIPPQGGDMYVGLTAKSAPVPKEVRPSGDDEKILEIVYNEDGSREEITIEAWKEELAREWEISLDEMEE